MFASNIELITISVSLVCIPNASFSLSALEKPMKTKNSSLFFSPQYSVRLHCVYRVRLSPLLFHFTLFAFCRHCSRCRGAAVVVVTATFLSFIFEQFLFRTSHSPVAPRPYMFIVDSTSSYLGIISDVSVRCGSIQYYCQLFHLKRNAHHPYIHIKHNMNHNHSNLTILRIRIFNIILRKRTHKIHPKH